MGKAVKMKDKNGNSIYPCPYYPIGSLYLSVINVNPANFFGGTWEQIKDLFLLACGDIYSAGSTGGEATHKLTVNEMPSHKHGIAGFPDGTSQGWADPNVRIVYHTTNDNPYPHIDALINSAGGDQAHNNMPPYLAIYVWKRIK